MVIDTIVCDEITDPVVDDVLQQIGVTVDRPDPAETDADLLRLARQHEAPILTRDEDFVTAHREGSNHFGILYDRRMHHRPTSEVIAALQSVRDVMDAADLRNTVVRLNQFY